MRCLKLTLLTKWIVPRERAWKWWQKAVNIFVCGQFWLWKDVSVAGFSYNLPCRPLRSLEDQVRFQIFAIIRLDFMAGLDLGTRKSWHGNYFLLLEARFCVYWYEILPSKENVSDRVTNLQVMENLLPFIFTPLLADDPLNISKSPSLHVYSTVLLFGITVFRNRKRSNY